MLSRTPLLKQTDFLPLSGEVEGPLELGLVGVLSDLASDLAREGIAILVFTTYPTFYIMVKRDFLEAPANRRPTIEP